MITVHSVGNMNVNAKFHHNSSSSFYRHFTINPNCGLEEKRIMNVCEKCILSYNICYEAAAFSSAFFFHFQQYLIPRKQKGVSLKFVKPLKMFNMVSVLRGMSNPPSLLSLST